MGIPLKQALAVGKYVAAQRVRGRRRFPLVLMLEPLYKCNLACPGCGKIQHPAETLRRTVPVDQCLAASDQCGAPVVSIAGGEPLLHPGIADVVRGLLAQGRIVYLCTNGLLLEEKLGLFQPDDAFNLNVHLDGDERHHDGRRPRRRYRIASSDPCRGARIPRHRQLHDLPRHEPEALHRFSTR
jgi:hopanoid biosynthesis associated radical SAM protein HpnH